MSDLSITASQVLPSTNAIKAQGVAGATITQGQPLCKVADGTLKPADANDSTLNGNIVGIALNAASTGQPVTYETGGDITLGAGAAPVSGVVYVVSGTPGGIAPAADIASGWKVITLGVGNASNGLRLGLNNSGATK